MKWFTFRPLISLFLCASMLLPMPAIAASNKNKKDQKTEQSYYEWTMNGIKKGAQWGWDHKAEVGVALALLWNVYIFSRLEFEKKLVLSQLGSSSASAPVAAITESEKKLVLYLLKNYREPTTPATFLTHLANSETTVFKKPNHLVETFNNYKATCLTINYEGSRQVLSAEGINKLAKLITKYLNNVSPSEKNSFNLDSEYDEWLSALVKVHLNKSRVSKNSQ